jgi:hypothetical protein
MADNGPPISDDMTRPEMVRYVRNAQRAARWTARAALAVTFASVVMALLFAAMLVYVVPRIKAIAQGTTPVTVSSKQYQAEQRFLLCSRSSTILDPAKVRDLKAVCMGYRTLTEAYASQHVNPPKENKP